jgi:hypothetical protein
VEETLAIWIGQLSAKNGTASHEVIIGKGEDLQVLYTNTVLNLLLKHCFIILSKFYEFKKVNSI